MFGLGGIFVEVMKDVVLQQCPFGEDVAERMIRAIQGAPLPFDQSVLMIWPQVTGLIAGMIVLFAAAYVVFQRQEVRA